MKRILLISAVLACVLLLASVVSLPANASGEAPPYTTVNGVAVDNRWVAAAGAASAADRLYATVAYDHVPTAIDVANLAAVGLTVVPYAQLPYAAVGGTKDQISAAIS